MRFIKRLVFIIILLLIAFFVYRLINPQAAQSLLFDLKTFSNDTIGTHFSFSGETLLVTGVVLDTTGTVVQDTGFLQEFSGDDVLLLNDSSLPQDTGVSLIEETTGTISQTPCPAMPTVNTCPTDQEKYVSYNSPECGIYYSCRAKTITTPTTKTTTSSNGLSAKDIRDANAIDQGFGN